MPQIQLVAIPCEISQGSISDERIFSVQTSEGEPISGAVPVFYLWTKQGQKLGPNDPPGDRKTGGLIAARLLQYEDDGEYALVSIPTGDVISIQSKFIRNRPGERTLNVSV